MAKNKINPSLLSIGALTTTAVAVAIIKKEPEEVEDCEKCGFPIDDLGFCSGACHEECCEPKKE